MRIKHILLLLVVCPMLALAQNPADSLRESLAELAQKRQLPGFGVAIASSEKLLFQAGYGMANREAAIAYSEESTQNIGSVSKTFVGLAVMKAVELGMIQLDDPVSAHIPFSPVNPFHPGKPIKVWHLVTHTSSILDRAYYWKSYVLDDPVQVSLTAIPKKDRRDFKKAITHEKMSMEAYFRAVLLPEGKWYAKKNYASYEPGGKYSYSNIAAALAAFVVESASGQAFPVFCQTHIFDPLGMNDTGWRRADIDRKHHARNYFTNGTPIPAYSLLTYPDGGLLTSSRDMARYMQEMMRALSGKGTLLKKEQYDVLFKQLLPDSAKPSTFSPEETTAVFWHYEKDFVGHSGGDPGIISLLRLFPEKDISLYLVTNVSANENKEMLAQFRNIWKLLSKWGSKISAFQSE